MIRSVRNKSAMTVNWAKKRFDSINDKWAIIDGDWSQLSPKDNDCRQELVVRLSRLLGFSLTDNNNILLHRIGENGVPRHTDRMSKKVYVIPLQFKDGVIFYDDDNKRIFKKGFHYVLNDFIPHGVDVRARTVTWLITVDT